jgi:hypothetical protein
MNIITTIDLPHRRTRAESLVVGLELALGGAALALAMAKGLTPLAASPVCSVIQNIVFGGFGRIAWAFPAIPIILGLSTIVESDDDEYVGHIGSSLRIATVSVLLVAMAASWGFVGWSLNFVGSIGGSAPDLPWIITGLYAAWVFFSHIAHDVAASVAEFFANRPERAPKLAKRQVGCNAGRNALGETKAAKPSSKVSSSSASLVPYTIFDQGTRFDESEARIRRITESFRVKLNENKVEAKFIAPILGPVTTRYRFSPVGGNTPKVSKVRALAEDLAMSADLDTLSIIRNGGMYEIELQNAKPSILTMRDFLDKVKVDRDGGTYAVGFSTTGAPVTQSLEASPHALVTGTTGAGKSWELRAILCSLLALHAPEDLQVVLIDPKRAEFCNYSGIPHLRGEVVTNAAGAVIALQDVYAEMHRRYELFSSEGGVDNLRDYNAGKRSNRLPRIAVMIDEAAMILKAGGDPLMSVVSSLLAEARAAGIHVILCTQSPRANIVEGEALAQLTTRIALKAASELESRIALGLPGAEALPKHGAMLYVGGDVEMQRLQAPKVGVEERDRLVAFLRGTNLEVKSPYAPSQAPKMEAPSVEVEPPTIEPPTIEPLWEETVPPLDADDIEAWVEKGLDFIEGRDRLVLNNLKSSFGKRSDTPRRVIEILVARGYLGQPVAEKRPWPVIRDRNGPRATVGEEVGV